MILAPDIYVAVAKMPDQDKFTMWTAPASLSVPLLAQLDMRAPLAGAQSARERVAKAKVRIKAMLAFFVSRPSSESLRKVVK